MKYHLLINAYIKYKIVIFVTKIQIFFLILWYNHLIYNTFLNRKEVHVNAVLDRKSTRKF